MSKNIKKIATRLVAMALAIVCLVTVFPAVTAHAAENYYGFYAWVVAADGATVYRYKNLTSRIGTVYNHEGVTVLADEGDSYYIEYCTSSTTKKRGYIAKDTVWTEENETCVGKMYSSQTVYYGKNSSTYLSAGSIGAGEYVAVLANDGSWTYIEYNTSSGVRKRGYVPTYSVQIFNPPAGMKPYYKYSGSSRTISSPWTCNIYAGPSEQYHRVGSITAGETITIISEFNISFNKFYFIEYTENSTKKLKSGYVLAGLS